MSSWPWPKGEPNDGWSDEELEGVLGVTDANPAGLFEVIATRSDGARLLLTDEVDIFGQRLAEVQLQDGTVLPQRMVPQAFLKFGGWDEAL